MPTSAFLTYYLTDSTARDNAKHKILIFIFFWVKTQNIDIQCKMSHFVRRLIMLSKGTRAIKLIIIYNLQ